MFPVNTQHLRFLAGSNVAAVQSLASCAVRINSTRAFLAGGQLQLCVASLDQVAQLAEPRLQRSLRDAAAQAAQIIEQQDVRRQAETKRDHACVPRQHTLRAVAGVAAQPGVLGPGGAARCEVTVRGWALLLPSRGHTQVRWGHGLQSQAEQKELLQVRRSQCQRCAMLGCFAPLDWSARSLTVNLLHRQPCRTHQHCFWVATQR